MEFLITGPDAPRARLILAHGAGAAMDSAFMTLVAQLLADRGITTLRFEFGYMAARRNGGPKRPPPKAEKLLDEYRAAIAEAPGSAPLYIGGKSMGGRVASMVADEARTTGSINGLVCLGYPFHPPNTPTTMRTAHLLGLSCPALIIQGERDPLGTRQEVEALTLSPTVKFAWSPDGDHDLGPRGASGFTRKANLTAAADAIAAFVISSSKT
jgi:predicted alpha/beta-hydrolase family hydrolase